jgi:hypothetical protein
MFILRMFCSLSITLHVITLLVGISFCEMSLDKSMVKQREKIGLENLVQKWSRFFDRSRKK